jgi:hypothetical protein
MRHLFWAFRYLLVFLIIARVDAVSAQSGPAVNPLQSDLISSWVVTVSDEPRQRSLIIRGVAAGTNGSFLLDATYGWLDGKLKQVRGEMTQSGTERRLELVTPADSKIVAKQLTDGSFAGTLTSKNGVVKPVKLERLESVAINSSPTTPANNAAAQTTPANIHMVVMGGNDCPPCVAWRGLELPKLQQTAAFKAIRFSYVAKAVKSPVPSSMFLPDEVKPYKARLDEASSGRSGSPQVAIIVNGEIYDYYFGTRSAKEVEQMILAIKDGGKYPFRRCLKRDKSAQCAVPA